MEHTTAAKIDEAPSLADIMSADDRVGAVDFDSHLAADPPPAEPGDAEETHQHSLRADADSGAESGSLPFILPPAKVDAAMAAKVAEERAEEEERLRAEEAEAAAAAEEAERLEAEAEAERAARRPRSRRRRDDDEPAGADHTDEDAGDRADQLEHDGDLSEAADAPAPRRGWRPGRASAPAPVEPEVEETVVTDPLAGLTIDGPANLDEVGARLAAESGEPQPGGVGSALDTEYVEGELVDDGHSTSYGGEMGDYGSHPGSLGGSATPGFDPSAPQTVAEVAARATAAIEAARIAHERWLEAMHLETTRRYELTTAQAELDAELIRIHGRRDATAFLAHARRSAGVPAEEADEESEQLTEIGETFSRFAESIESAVSSAQTPDPYRES